MPTTLTDLAQNANRTNPDPNAGYLVDASTMTYTTGGTDATTGDGPDTADLSMYTGPRLAVVTAHPAKPTGNTANGADPSYAPAAYHDVTADFAPTGDTSGADDPTYMGTGKDPESDEHDDGQYAREE